MVMTCRARRPSRMVRRSFRACWFVGLSAALIAPWSIRAAESSLLDAWDAIYIGNQKAGWIHSVTDRVDAKGHAVLQTRQTMQLSVKRFNDDMNMSLVTHAFELPDGRLYAIDARLKMAGQEQKTVGRLDNDGRFTVTVSTLGKEQSQTIPWGADILGPYAHERSLRETPLKVGESRTLKTFLPELNVVSTRTLKGIRKEKTPLLGKTSDELLLVEESNDKLPVVGRLWVDSHGDIVKNEFPMGDLLMTNYRVSPSQALGKPAENDIDLGYRTLVAVDKPIPGAHQTASVTYRLTFADPSAASAFPAAPYQEILSRDGPVVRVKVSRRIPPAERTPPTTSAPAEFLASNGFIQSDDPEIIAAARKVVGGEKDPWVQATLLEAWVDRVMSSHDFSIGFATAGEVIRTKTGDCTEHAVLLAALCRAVGVPARVAMGLVYLEGDGRFGYHMWTEVWIAGAWYALDGTLGRGAVSGGHLKIADGSLQGASALSTFLPIFNVMGKLTINVEAIEPSPAKTQ